MLTIEELVDKVNSLISVNDVQDARVSSQLSVRRVRDYQSKGLLREPIRSGRNSYYDDKHVEQLVALRSMQNTGLSDGVLKKITASSPLYYQSSDVSADSGLASSALNISASLAAQNSVNEDSPMKKKALDALAKISNNQEHNIIASSQSATNVSLNSLAANVLSMGKGLKSSESYFKFADINDKVSSSTSQANDLSSLEISSQNYVSDPNEDKYFKENLERVARTPKVTQSYHVYEKIRLDVESGVTLSDDEKLLIIQRLQDIIQSI